MTAFGNDDIDWSRLDVCALLACNGIATVTGEDASATCEWLREEGYDIDTLDVSGGVASTLRRFDEIFRWQEQFGYTHQGERYSLDALRDGFDVAVPNGRAVLQIVGADELWRVDSVLISGLLAIASEHSIYHLAIGNRFFVLLIIASNSNIIGQPIETVSVPVPFPFHARS